MVIVANPNNPSATLASRTSCAACALAHPASWSSTRPTSTSRWGRAWRPACSLLREHDNLVVLRTFSKSYSLAGARLGLLFAAPALVAELTKVKDSYNVNVITQALGVAALEDREHHRELIAQTLAQRARLETELAAMGFTWPESAANFLLCTPPVAARAEEIYLALKAQGLLVRWWERRSCATGCASPSGRPRTTTV